MPENNRPLPPERLLEADPLNEGGLRAPPGLSTWRKLWWWFDFLILVKLARLRFVGILFAIGLLIVYWDTLIAYYDKYTRAPALEQAAHSDIEYFCPMHPQVVTADPKAKCPICFMNLSRRKKGGETTEALPAGVVNRVQLSPYRVVLAGIETAEASYQPLVKEIHTVGFVEFNEEKLSRISARITGRNRIERLFVNVTGQQVKKGEPLALLYSPDLVVTVQNLLDAQAGGNARLERGARERLQLWGIAPEEIDTIVKTRQPLTQITIRSPISGHVIKKYQVEGEYVEEGARLYDIADLHTVWIEAQVYEREIAFLKEGLAAQATTEAFPHRVFPGKLSFIHPHLDAATRTLKVRFDVDNPNHDLRPGMYADVKIEVPVSDVHRSFATGEGCVLAVPESAVIYTGEQKVVYRQSQPNVFDAVRVEVGPPMTGPSGQNMYPVLHGLEAGDKVVTVGAYLLDAETRVSAAAGSIYYGGGGSSGKSGSTTVSGTVRPSTPEDEEANAQAALAKLSTVDRQLVEAQKFCPILSANRLGGMGTPLKIMLNGEPVFLCCKECEERARANPQRTLDKVNRLRTGTKEKTEVPAAPAGVQDRRADAAPLAIAALAPEKAEKVKKALAQLSPADRALVAAQGYCPVEPETVLGSMGAPVKIMLKGQPVFLCCKGCVDEAKEHPEQTLATFQKLKSREAAKPAR